jgi:MraZ protein
MYLGEYEHTIDQKGRIAIPVKFRTSLAEGAVVTRGVDNCLTLYPKKEWEQLAQNVAGLPINDPHARSFARLMLAGAMAVDADKQGRIILPAYLRQYAGLGAAVVVVGLYNRIEIWDKAAWKQYSDESQANASDIASQLGEVTL